MHPEQAFTNARRLLKAGREQEAQHLLLQLRQTYPKHAQTVHLLGFIAYQRGDMDTAIATIREAIGYDASRPSFHNNLGNAYKAKGDLDNALACYQEALRLNPNYGGAYYNLGVLQNAMGRRSEAIGSLRQCVLLSPDNLDARLELAELLRGEGELEGATHQYTAILRKKENHYEALVHLAGVYSLQGYLDKAEHLYRKAQEIRPDEVLVEYNLGKICYEQHHERESVEHFERCLELEPGHWGARVELAFLRINTCDWSQRDSDVENLTRFFEEDLRQAEPSHNRTWSLNQFPSSRKLHVRVAGQKAWSIERATVETRKRCAFVHGRATPEKLRIGYVSPDFRRHAVGVLAHAMFGHHDRDGFEVFGYALNPVSDQYTHAVRQGCDRFAEVSKRTPEALARQIHGDGIHILVDMAGYTTHSRPEIFALRPAPVQVQYLGFLNTMGAPFIDYTIADNVVMDEPLRRLYSEKILYMPDCFLVSSPLAVPEIRLKKGECGLPDDGVVFACFNAPYKIEPEIFDAWMSILRRVPDSVLWLFAASEDWAGEHLRREAGARDVDSGRIVSAGRLPMEKHLARCRLADLFLDTPLYNGGATTITALQAGLPVLTHYGTTVHSRMGASIVKAAGLPELVGYSVDEYVERAVELAHDRTALNELKSRLQSTDNPPPLFDTAQFVRHLEEGYRVMWRNWLDGAPTDIPAPFP